MGWPEQAHPTLPREGQAGCSGVVVRPVSWSEIVRTVRPVRTMLAGEARGKGGQGNARRGQEGMGKVSPATPGHTHMAGLRRGNTSEVSCALRAKGRWSLAGAPRTPRTPVRVWNDLSGRSYGMTSPGGLGRAQGLARKARRSRFTNWTPA